MPYPSLKQKLKRLVLPTDVTPRRVPFGIGRGLRFNVDFQGGFTRTYLGLYEIELNKHLRSLCRPGFKSFDVGGQVGYDALVIASLTGARVVSVECDPASIRMLGANISLNPTLADQVEVKEAFVACKTDKAAGHLSLDDLAESTFMPDFIKMDIEGGESAGLGGSTRILTKRKPNLLIEVHGRDQENQCMTILVSAGYDPLVVDHRRWLPDHRPLAHNRWLVAFGNAA